MEDINFACNIIIHALVITCENLSDISDGLISYATVPNPNFVFGTIATYTCVNGFGLRGGDKSRVCVGDGSSPLGEWSGATPSCECMSFMLLLAMYTSCMHLFSLIFLFHSDTVHTT